MVNIENAKKIDGWMTEAELTWLANQARHCSFILEVGSWHGRSTRAISDNLNGPYATVIAVDHFLGSKDERETNHSLANQDDAYLEFFKNNHEHIMSGKITVLRCDFQSIASILIANRIKFEMIFIDGGHSYEEVKKDINDAFLLLKPGGLICGHDYCDTWPGVKKAVDELVPERGKMNDGTIWYAVKCDKCSSLFEPGWDTGLENTCENCGE